jgi:hypothetical protein
MEKAVYILWRRPEDSKEAFSARLRGDVADELLRLGVRGLQANVADDDVAAAMLRMATLEPQMEAVVSVWLDTVMDRVRRPVEDALARAAARVEGYLVTESEPMRNTTHPPVPGSRTFGLANMAFIRRPSELPREQWLDAWQNHHTEVALDTQSTFGYVQNVVVRPLTADAPAVDGIVEELFPPEAMTDLHAFYDAIGDDDKLAKNMAAMMESIGRFGAGESVDVVPTSQYIVKAPV